MRHAVTLSTRHVRIVLLPLDVRVLHPSVYTLGTPDTQGTCGALARVRHGAFCVKMEKKRVERGPMSRRRSSLSLIRSMLYALARLLGDIQAIRRSPNAMAKRMALRASGKVTGRMLERLLR